MQIIPAIDIIDGKCVRLTEGDYNAITEYNGSPLDIAKQYEDNGISRLHLVDLDGAKAGSVVNWKTVEQIASQTELIVDFGGGVKNREDIKRIIELGVKYVTIGSIAAKNPSLFSSWIDEFGSGQFLLGADVKDGNIMVGGWTEKLELQVIPYLNGYFKKGISTAFCTDVSKDGKLQGPSIELYREIINLIPGFNLIASGGVSCMDDIYLLDSIGCSGVIIGKAIYENKISIPELTEFISQSRKN
jgi:phosphoribosylformimino-5-aminoimidazole carboxamide ribotide isomerase